jgi:hypothetical protein
METRKTPAKSTFGSEEKIQLPARDPRYEPHSTPTSEVLSRNLGNKGQQTGKMVRESLCKNIGSKRSVHEDQICAPCLNSGVRQKDEACEEDIKVQLELKKVAKSNLNS